MFHFNMNFQQIQGVAILPTFSALEQVDAVLLLAVGVEAGEADKVLWTVITHNWLASSSPSLPGLGTLLLHVDGLHHGE